MMKDSMRNLIKQVYHCVVPQRIQALRRRFVAAQCDRKWHKALAGSLDIENSEHQKILAFLGRNSLCMFNYDFSLKYDANDIKVYREDGFPYVMEDGKKLFFPRTWSEFHVKCYYNGLRMEQDVESPHCYIKNEARRPLIGAVVADVGAAEGIFALSVVERVSKLYLFECDKKWMEPLHRTFAPYAEKIEIVNKYIGAENKGNTVTLDSFFEGKPIDYIKADIEGAEVDLLAGGAHTFRYKLSQSLLCLYHRQTDEYDITRKLKEYGLQIDINSGYMLLIFDKDTWIKPPYIRRGVVYAWKNK